MAYNINWQEQNLNPAYNPVYSTQSIARNNLNEQKRQYDIGQANYLADIANKQKAASQYGTGLASMVNEYNRAFADARAESEGRYNQMLGLVDNTSGQQAADIQQTYLNQGIANNQQLAKLGMGGTTIGSSLQSGVNRSKSAALNTLADTMNKERLSIMQNKEKAAAYAPSTDILRTLIGTAASNPYALGTGATALSQLSS